MLFKRIQFELLLIICLQINVCRKIIFKICLFNSKRNIFLLIFHCKLNADVYTYYINTFVQFMNKYESYHLFCQNKLFVFISLKQHITSSFTIKLFPVTWPQLYTYCDIYILMVSQKLLPIVAALLYTDKKHKPPCIFCMQTVLVLSHYVNS